MEGNFQRKKRATIKMVANEAGVSTQTVSRVLNNRPDVAPKTRERVQAVIKRLNYHPSAVARSLIHQRTNTIGVVTIGLKNMGPSRTLTGIAHQAEECGYSLLLKESPKYNLGDYQVVLRSLLDRRVDGIIWAVSENETNRQWLEELIPDLSVPVIFLGIAPFEGGRVLTIDNYRGGQIATQYLLELGYAQIGHISGPLEFWDANSRKLGWEDTLEQAGFEVSSTQFAQGNWTAASGEQAMDTLLAQFPQMEAVFVSNDQMALGAIRALYARNLEIPADIAVIGYDGIPESAYFHPPLTTIYQDLHTLGCMAVNTLVGIIEKRRQGLESDTESLVLQPELIIRESTIPGQPHLTQQ
jgi:LacI family transcriptional regulator